MQWILPGRRMNWNCQHRRYSWLALSFFPRKVSTLSHCCCFQRKPFFEKFKHQWVFHSFLTLSFTTRQVPCSGRNVRCPMWSARRLMRAELLNTLLHRLFLLLSFGRSGVSNSATPWTAARQASLSITSSRTSTALWQTDVFRFELRVH